MTDANDISIYLDNLDDLRSNRELIRIDMEEKREKAIPQEVKNVLDDINAEYLPRLEVVDQRIADLTAAIETLVCDFGATVHGKNLMAVYGKPRTSWDTKKLDGYAAAHPEILAFKKVGDKPTISIRSK